MMLSNKIFGAILKCSDLQLLNVVRKILAKSSTVLNKISTFQNWDNMTSLWSDFCTVSVPLFWNSDVFVTTCHAI